MSKTPHFCLVVPSKGPKQVAQALRELAKQLEEDYQLDHWERPNCMGTLEDGTEYDYDVIDLSETSLLNLGSNLLPKMA